MADFNVSLSPVQGEGARPVAPVQEQVVPYSPNELLKGVVNIFANGLKANQKQQAMDRKKAVVEEYMKNEQVYADAFSSGQWNAAQAATASRANYAKYAGSHSEYLTELSEARKEVYGGTEIGEVERKRLADIKQRDDDKARAAGRGYSFYDGMSPDVENKIIDASQESIRLEHANDQAQKAQAAQYAANAEVRANGSFMMSKEAHAISVDKYREDENIARGMITVASKNFDVIDAVSKDLMGQNIPFEEKQLKFTTQTQHIKDAVSAIAVRNPSLAAPFLRLIEERENIFKQMADPKARTQAEHDALKTQYDTMVLKTKIMLVSDEKTRGAVALSNLFGNSDAVMQLGFSPVITGNLAKLGLGPNAGAKAPQVVGAEGEKQTLQALRKTLQQFSAGAVAGDPAKQQVEAANAVNNVLEQTGALRGSVDPKQLKDLSEFYSSSEFGKLAEKGMLDKPTMDNAKRVFQVSYEPAVTQAIQSRLDETITHSPGRDGGMRGKRPDQKLSDTVNIKFNGSGVVFENKRGTEDTISSDITKKGLKEAESGLNTLIKMGAHMEGTTNYAKYWEENKHHFLPTVFPDPNKLKVGQVVTAKNGKKYKYTGGDYNDVAGSYVEIPDNGKSSE